MTGSSAVGVEGESAPEEILEPGVSITDSHHHLWDHHQPSYVLDELLADTACGHNVESTVYIECGWKWDTDSADPRFMPVPEVEHVVGLAEESSRRGNAAIRGIVGFADLRFGSSVGEVLDRLVEAGHGLLAGIRQCANWDASSEVSTHPTKPGPELLLHPAVRRGLKQVADRDLTFDTWIYHPQLRDLVDLARAYPTVTMVVDHLGGPLALGPYAKDREASRDTWRRGMRELRSCENVFVKLGGIGMPALAGVDASPSPTSEELAGRWASDIGWCIEEFGADRCMFESNFPVDRRACSYRVLWNTFKRVVADGSDQEKAALFTGTAARVYGIGTR